MEEEEGRLVEVEALMIPGAAEEVLEALREVQVLEAEVDRRRQMPFS